jgi:hypothetical protein
MPKASNIILVHGAWADGSSWAKVIPILMRAKLSVAAAQLPLTSLADDVATVKRALALVVSLVYIAAFAPDVGQSAGSLGASAASTPWVVELGKVH